LIIWRKANTDVANGEFAIDLTAPNAPNLLFPTAQDSINLPGTITWNSDSDVLNDSLYIFTDSLGTAPILVINTNDQFHTIDAIPTDEYYYWQVKSTDIAGNESEPSPIGRFFVKD